MSLRTGVIGTGTVARNNHLPAVARNPRTRLVAICDADGERARDAAAEYGGVAYVDAADMVAEEDLDWAHVATPVGTHHALARTTLEAGVPTTVQKPATVTLDELDDLTALAEEADVPVSVVHNWLYYPVVREVRRRVAAGEIGRIRAVETTFAGEGRPDETYRGDWVFDLPGGEFEEGFPHPVYLTTALGGDPPNLDAVDVRTRRAGTYDRGIEYDGLSLQYVSEGDALCSVTFLTGGSTTQVLWVHGEDGSLFVDLVSRTVRAYDLEEGPFHQLGPRLGRNTDDLRTAARGLARNLAIHGIEWAEGRFDVHLADSPDGHYYLFDRAASALERGRQPPVPLERSRWTIGFMERVRETAARGATAPSSPAKPD